MTVPGGSGAAPLPDPEPPPNIAIRAVRHLAEDLIYSLNQDESPAIAKCDNDASVPAAAEPTMPQYTVESTTTLTTPTQPNNNTSIHSLYGAHSHNRLSTIRLMQQAMNRAMPLNKRIRLHIDGGANRSITNDHSLLLQFRNNKPYHMSTAGGDTDITCTGLGYLPW
jgi:hypothetical protein